MIPESKPITDARARQAMRNKRLNAQTPTNDPIPTVIAMIFIAVIALGFGVMGMLEVIR